MRNESVSQWLDELCERRHLSNRQAAALTGLSHATIADIRHGVHPLPGSILKLAKTFSSSHHQRLVLEDQLLILAGYRSPRPEGEELSEALAQHIDKVSEFSEEQLKMMDRFGDFLIEISYVRGYREVPESTEEVEATHQVGIATLAEEPYTRERARKGEKPK